jgi:two-component system LytT family sensor kinase
MNYFQRTPIRYRIILITAGVMATLFLFQAYTRHVVCQDLEDTGAFNWWREAPVPYLNFLLWALLSPLVYSLMQRWPFESRPLLRTIAIHLGLGLLIATVHEVVTSTLYYALLQVNGDFDFGDPQYRSRAYHALVPAIFTRAMEYGVLMGVLVALENARLRRKEHEQLLDLRNELQTSQLNALKKQLQPHFLFNTLNTVSALMDENINDARKVLSRLGQMLRTTLDATQRDKVSLAAEVQHVTNYLDIESIRFRDRLHVEYIIDDDARSLAVPSMVLQPLVENSIKHGPDATSDNVLIRITATRNADQLLLQVRDNGKGCATVCSAMEHGGIGLRNVRNRLLLLYGERAGIRIASPEGRGFLVELHLPIEPA